MIFDVFEILESKNINYRKNRHNFIDCNINGYDFTIDHYAQETRIKNLINAIIELSKENEELKKDNKVLYDLNKEQNEVFSNFAKIIKENRRFRSICKILQIFNKSYHIF